MRLMPAAAAIALTLSACSQSQESAPASMREQSADASADDGKSGAAGKPEAAAADADAGSSAPAVSGPRIAYVYEYGYRVAAAAMPALQRKHADMCEKQGPTQCRILDMRQSGSEGDYATGSLAMAVAAPRARAFGVELAKAAGQAGGEETSSSISGEDLSKQIVDTEARLRARTLLRDRLMEVLATRKGTVAELVEAERGVAQVNEEIDQARAWLAEMQGRVDFSRVNLSYASQSPSGGGFMAPIRDATGNIGSILGLLFAAIIVGLTVLIPVGLIVLAVRAAWRKLRPARRSAPASGEETAENPNN